MPTAEGFSRSQVAVHRDISARDPLLVVGLPGIGFVSKLAVDHLVAQVKAKKVATIRSPYFPNQVIALKSGKLRMFSMRFYHKRLRKRDVIFLKGDIQPLSIEGQYEVCSRALEYFGSVGGTQVISMAGFAVSPGHDRAPAIYCTSTSKKFHATFKKLGARNVDRSVPIVGMAGLFPGLAKAYGMKGACLLVETPGSVIDAKGATALVKLLGFVAGEKFDTSHLEARAKKAQEMIRRLNEQAQPEEPKAGELPQEDIIRRSESLSYIR
jgi:uncharacterized protein (TIGR00162 family)